VVSFTDITARRATEDERQRLTEQLIHSQKTEALARLAGGIAHDFNNLLAIVLGEVSLLEDDLAGHEGLDRSRLERLRKVADRGAALVRQLLAYARKADVELETVELNAMVQEVTQLVRETFPRSIEVTCSTTTGPLHVRGDATQIQQVLLNLSVNARDAMPEGGRLHLETSETRPTSGGAPPMARLRVRDTGTGMDAELQQRIFDPFFTTKDFGRGTGLGLAVVQGIVEYHGGIIRVDSAPGRGTTFTIDLPTTTGEAPAEVRSTALAVVRGGRERILVVEDEPMVREVVVDLLSRKGYECVVAEDGARAVTLLAQHGATLSAVLTDLGLPKLEGAPLVRRLRAGHPTVPIVVASGLIEPGVEEALREAGVSEIIWKPYDLGVLAASVRRVIDEQTPMP
jgi:nitrogen-specific signal transduction histidine kinase/ActR/RegA family two-component response regulator